MLIKVLLEKFWNMAVLPLSANRLFKRTISLPQKYIEFRKAFMENDII